MNFITADIKNGPLITYTDKEVQPRLFTCGLLPKQAKELLKAAHAFIKEQGIVEMTPVSCCGFKFALLNAKLPLSGFPLQSGVQVIYPDKAGCWWFQEDYDAFYEALQPIYGDHDASLT